MSNSPPINYKSERDFIVESDSLLETIKDTSTLLYDCIESDWQVRMRALEIIKSIVLGNAPTQFHEAFDAFLIKSIVPITNQVLLAYS